MPVTGQAKGIAIGRGGEQAFDMPRRACPRLNVTVRKLAAPVVTRPEDRLPDQRCMTRHLARGLSPQDRANDSGKVRIDARGNLQDFACG
jgi:hypothetical protein